MQTQQHPGNEGQWREALKLANAKREARCKLKDAVKQGRVSVAAIILNPPDILRTSSRSGSRGRVSLADVLSWQHRWGTERSRTFCNRLGISPSVGIQDLSPSRRQQVALRLKHQH